MSEQSLTYPDKLQNLRKAMLAQGVDGFLVPRGDEFLGEFVAPYAERLAWLTGFSGSAGLAIVLQDRAVVMSDGRYTLQLHSQVDPQIYDIANSVVTKPSAWLAENIAGTDEYISAVQDERSAFVLGYDPFLHTQSQVSELRKALKDKPVVLRPVNQNLIDMIWVDQPTRPLGHVSLFPEDVAGHSASEKIEILSDAILQAGARYQILSGPESICWLLNIRGCDVDYVPLVLGYGVVDAQVKNVELFVEPEKISEAVKDALSDRVRFYALNMIEERLEAVASDSKALKGHRILIDERRSPVFFDEFLRQRDAKISYVKDFCVDLRAVKNASEQQTIQDAHVIDGVAVTKFLCWLERSGKKILSKDKDAPALSEIAAADKLEEFRRENPAYIGPSFPTISGFADHGAVIHYRANESSNKIIDQAGVLLVDSGGQYHWGTTDITRTIAIGAVEHDFKKFYTLVLKGHISLAMAKFPCGTRGAQMDVLARSALWNEEADFAHGTGHGVGCYLSVHEEAAHISSRCQEALQPGMLLSNEPGYYRAGAYGIRLENLVFVQRVHVQDGKDDSAQGRGDMLCFDTVTLAPFDPACIEIALLSPQEKVWLNAYHARVYDALSPSLSEDERQWLEEKTKPVI